MRGKAKVLRHFLAACVVSFLGVAFAQAPTAKSVLHPGPHAGNTVYLANGRNYAFCEFEVVEGVPPNDVTMQVYNTTGTVPCTAEKFGPINAETLAQQLGVLKVIKNPPRYWLMDSLWSYDAGESHVFDGIKATWMASVKIPPELLEMMGKGGHPFAPYRPTVVSRHSKYLWKKGSEIYLLRDPDGKPWIMQAYTNLVDTSMTITSLRNLGAKLKLPAGWKYEVKTLDRDFTYDPPKNTGYQVHAVSDDLQNVYQACGFDDACNYVP